MKRQIEAPLIALHAAITESDGSADLPAGGTREWWKAMKAGDRVPMDGGAPLGQSPFAKLNPASLRRSGLAIPDAGKETAAGPVRPPVSASPVQKNRGRLEIRRQTQGRGGKTVTVVSGFMGIGQPEKEQLAKKMQKTCGAGGTVKDGCIEIQGDKREPVAKILAEAGFRPVFAGG
jgi:translation initiation factor 1